MGLRALNPAGSPSEGTETPTAEPTGAGPPGRAEWAASWSRVGGDGRGLVRKRGALGPALAPPSEDGR